MSVAMSHVELSDEDRRPMMLNENDVYLLCAAKIGAFNEEWDLTQFYIAHVVLGDFNCDFGSVRASLEDIAADRYVSREDLKEGAVEATVTLLKELEGLWVEFYGEETK